MHKLRTIEMQRLSVDEFHEANKLPLIVVLDDVRSVAPYVLRHRLICRAGTTPDEALTAALNA